MTTALLRAQLESTGEFAGAIRRLPETYSAEEYLVAVQAARDAGDGGKYADSVLGVDANDADSVTAVDQDIYDLAMTLLAKRGVHEPTYSELADALVQVAT